MIVIVIVKALVIVAAQCRNLKYGDAIPCGMAPAPTRAIA